MQHDERYLQALAAYDAWRAVHPDREPTQSEGPVGLWAARQRAVAAAGKLSKARRDALSARGFAFTTVQGAKRTRTRAARRSERGHAATASAGVRASGQAWWHTVAGQALDRAIRKDKHNHKLSDTDADQLVDLGWTANGFDAAWEHMAWLLEGWLTDPAHADEPFGRGTCLSTGEDIGRWWYRQVRVWEQGVGDRPQRAGDLARDERFRELATLIAARPTGIRGRGRPKKQAA